MKSITKLIASLALMGVLTLAIVMSTVAWFSANREATATGITVTAGMETYMEFSADFSAGSMTAAVANPATTESLTPLQMFNTSKVATAASCATHTTTIHYASASDGLLTFTVTATASGTDYVTRGDISYVAVFDFGAVTTGLKVALYNGAYYVNSGTGTADLTLPAGITGSSSNWWALSSTTAYYNSTAIKLILTKNKDYPVTLYVFPAKTDDEIDPVLIANGATVKAEISVT